jgi:hypothetical protein
MTEPSETAERLYDERVWETDDGDVEALLSLAGQDPARFLWAADPGRVTPSGGAELQALLLPTLREAELAVGLPWLRQPGFLSDEQAVALLEQALERAEAGAGWFALAEALAALHDRGQRWKTARHLERLLERFWLDALEADAVQQAAAGFVDCGLVAALSRHEPWRSEPARLTKLAEGCSTRDLTGGLQARFDVHPEAAEELRLLFWDTLAGRKDGGALGRCAELLATRWHEPIGRTGGLNVVLALQRVHGDEAVPDLVAVFLSGTHRAPVGELIERWLLERAELALAAALEDLPDWMPRFEMSAMDRLCWRLLPRLNDDARLRVRELAETVGGERGAMVMGELESMGS